MVKFNRWSLIERVGKTRPTMWLCRCDCGKERVVNKTNVTRGLSKSCGCLNIEKIVSRSMTHGHSRSGKITRTYKIWVGINVRCRNKNSIAYKWYGMNGIKICDRWRSYQNFLDDMGECPEGLEIDRINNNGNYEPGNCRWTDRITNANNVRTNRLVWWNGKRQTMAQWCRELHLRYQLTVQRINRDHWTIERAFTS